MSAADKIRELAASGTQGKWQTDGPWWRQSDPPDSHSLISATPGRKGVLGPLEHRAADCGVVESDVLKAVVAVNALPAVADLIGDLSTHSQLAARCYECDRAWPCPTAVARDALIEALGVTK
jgi:hypothetical protein